RLLLEVGPGRVIAGEEDAGDGVAPARDRGEIRGKGVAIEVHAERLADKEATGLEGARQIAALGLVTEAEVVEDRLDLLGQRIAEAGAEGLPEVLLGALWQAHEPREVGFDVRGGFAAGEAFQRGAGAHGACFYTPTRAASSGVERQFALTIL